MWTTFVSGEGHRKRGWPVTGRWVQRRRVVAQHLSSRTFFFFMLARMWLGFRLGAPASALFRGSLALGSGAAWSV